MQEGRRSTLDLPSPNSASGSCGSNSPAPLQIHLFTYNIHSHKSHTLLLKVVICYGSQNRMSTIDLAWLLLDYLWNTQFTMNLMFYNSWIIFYTCKVGFKNPFLIRISETVIGLEDNKHCHEEFRVSVVETLRYYFLLTVCCCVLTKAYLPRINLFVVRKTKKQSACSQCAFNILWGWTSNYPHLRWDAR